MYDVSTEYGRAIFELALEENKDKLYLEQLREINKLLEENPGVYSSSLLLEYSIK